MRTSTDLSPFPPTRSDRRRRIQPDVLAMAAAAQEIKVSRSTGSVTKPRGFNWSALSTPFLPMRSIDRAEADAHHTTLSNKPDSGRTCSAWPTTGCAASPFTVRPFALCPCLCSSVPRPFHLSNWPRFCSHTRTNQCTPSTASSWPPTTRTTGGGAPTWSSSKRPCAAASSRTCCWHRESSLQSVCVCVNGMDPAIPSPTSLPSPPTFIPSL